MPNDGAADEDAVLAEHERTYQAMLREPWVAEGIERVRRGQQKLDIVARAEAVMSGRADRGAEKTPRFPHVWIDDADVDLTNDDHIKHLIARRSFVLIYGPSGDGKTFFTIDMFGHVADGIDWRGRRVQPGLIVYVAAEAGVSIVRRFFAWRRHRPKAQAERTPLAIITKGANLLNPVDVEALILELQRIAVEAGMPVAAVIFDTFSRSIPGGDENSAQDMTRPIEAADRIRDELNATTVFVHHSGKDGSKGARGHSSLFAAADTVISVIERVATVEKSRDGTAGEQFAFDLHVVELGEDQDSDPVTTCVVMPADASAIKPKAARLTPSEQIAFDALKEEAGVSGIALPESSVIPRGVRGVRIDAWRSRLYSRLGESKEADAKRQTWNRAKTGLIGRQIIGAWEEWVWIL